MRCEVPHPSSSALRYSEWQPVVQAALAKAGRPRITTEIAEAPEFFHAEAYHQQYLAKNPGGYCALRGTGVECAVPAPATA